MAVEQGTPGSTAALAKGALRRLAQAHLEPTPENYARAFAEEAGTAPPRAKPAVAGPGWPALVGRLVRNLERGSRQWTAARRKESLFRVLDGCRGDEEKLSQRLASLLQAWETERSPEEVDAARADGPDGEGPPAGSTRPAPLAGDAKGMTASDAAGEERTHVDARAPSPAMAAPSAPGAGIAVGALNGAVCAGLGDADRLATELAQRLQRLVDERDGASPGSTTDTDLAAACGEAKRWFGQRHELVRQLTALCAEMSQGLVELSEDESWSRGQCEALRTRLGEGIDLRGVREASAMLADTRTRQGAAKREREAARVALKQLLAGMIGEVGALQQQAGGFELAIERHASAVEAADSLEGLASVVQAMLADSRQLRTAVGASHERLQRDSRRAAELEARVRDLESELRRLSDEACTDALTQVANRRGLEQHFAAASTRAAAAGEALSVGLIDIDNFKKLNDRLGHAAGDTALKALAAEVSQRLRPGDQVARFGGEEFVVLLPGLPVDTAQQTLTRLQRSLSASLFLHEGEEVFVTFSAGVTAWRAGESLQAAVERADAALYEAKRTGKNRTCSA